MTLVEISTYIFLICSAAVLVPVALVGWKMYKARRGDGQDHDTSVLARMILLITIGVLLFHAAQFISVFLSKLGYSQQARVPVIFLIDGTLILLTLIYFYAYVRIRAIHSRIESKL